MTDTTPTNGPWTYIYEPTLNRVAIKAGEYEMMHIGTLTAREANKAKANAKLIAAAPCLLAALQAISDILNQPVQRSGTDSEIGTVNILRSDAKIAREMALSAIAKATKGN